jgi:hypothetical protein
MTPHVPGIVEVGAHKPVSTDRKEVVMNEPEYLRMESALSRLAQSGWRWSKDDPGPVYEIRQHLGRALEPGQATAVAELIMDAVDRWEEARRLH